MRFYPKFANWIHGRNGVGHKKFTFAKNIWDPENICLDTLNAILKTGQKFSTKGRKLIAQSPKNLIKNSKKVFVPQNVPLDT